MLLSKNLLSGGFGITGISSCIEPTAQTLSKLKATKKIFWFKNCKDEFKILSESEVNLELQNPKAKNYIEYFLPSVKTALKYKYLNPTHPLSIIYVKKNLKWSGIDYDKSGTLFKPKSHIDAILSFRQI